MDADVGTPECGVSGGMDARVEPSTPDSVERTTVAKVAPSSASPAAAGGGVSDEAAAVGAWLRAAALVPAAADSCDSAWPCAAELPDGPLFTTGGVTHPSVHAALLAVCAHATGHDCSDGKACTCDGDAEGAASSDGGPCWGVLVPALCSFFDVCEPELGLQRRDATVTSGGDWLQLARVVLTAAVQCDHRGDYIACITALPSSAMQGHLMAAIQMVLESAAGSGSAHSLDDDAATQSPASTSCLSLASASPAPRTPASPAASRKVLGDITASSQPMQQTQASPTAAGDHCSPATGTASPWRSPLREKAARGSASASPTPPAGSGSSATPASLAGLLDASPDVVVQRLVRRVTSLRHDKDELASIASDLRAQLATAREEADHTLVADASRSNRDRGEQLSAEVARLAEEQARWERLEAELAEAKGEAAAAARLGLEVSALRDEVDVLRPVRNQLATLQASHTRLKRRLEEAGDAKAALKTLEAQHAQLLERCLAAEDTASKVPALQARVSEYKASLTQSKLRVSDVEHALAQAQAENARLAASCAGLAVDARQAVSVSRDMQEQLQASAAEAHAASNASDSGGAVGAGVSQLNPEFAELVARLRKENQELRGQVDTGTVARVEELANELEDAVALRDSFEKRFRTADARANRLDSALATARQRIADLEPRLADCTALAARLRESHDMATEDAAELRAQRTAASQGWAQDHAALTQEARERQAQHAAAMEEARATLAQAQADSAAALAAAEERRAAAVAEGAAALQAAQSEMEAYVAAHNVSDEAHRAQVAELEASLASWQQQHSVSNEAHAAEVSELRGQVAQLEAAVEERGRSLTAASAEAAQLRADVAQRSEAHAALEAKFARIVKAGKAQLAKLTQEKHRAEQRSTLLSKLCDDVSAKEKSQRLRNEELKAQLGEASDYIKRLSAEAQQTSSSSSSKRRSGSNTNARSTAAGTGSGPASSAYLATVRELEHKAAALERENQTMLMSRAEQMRSRHELQSRVEALEQQLSDVNNANARLNLELKRMRRAGGGTTVASSARGSHPDTSPVSVAAEQRASGATHPPPEGVRPTPSTGTAAVRAAASSARRRRLRLRAAEEGRTPKVVRGIFGPSPSMSASGRREASPVRRGEAASDAEPAVGPGSVHDDALPSPTARRSTHTVAAGARGDGVRGCGVDAGAARAVSHGTMGGFDEGDEGDEGDAEQFVDASQLWGAGRLPARAPAAEVPITQPRRRVSIYAGRQSVIRQSVTRGTSDSPLAPGASRSRSSRAGALAGVMAALQ